MDWQIVYTREHDAINCVHDILYEYNLRHTGRPRQAGVTAQILESTEALIVCSDAGEVCGGLVWHTESTPEHYVRVDLFVVGEQLRGQGMGSKLMNEFLARAKAAGAEYVKLYTNTFQAPVFYKKMGFEVEKTSPAPQPNVPENESIHFIKHL